MKRSPQIVSPADFGARLAHQRELKHMSQAEVAEQIGVKANTISYYENGKSLPSLDLAVQLADLYNVSLDFLLNRDEYNNMSHATIRSVAESLLHLSRIRGVKITGDFAHNAASIEFRHNELAHFLVQYQDILRFFGTSASPEERESCRQQCSDLSETKYISVLLDELSYTPVHARQVDLDELLDQYAEQ